MIKFSHGCRKPLLGLAVAALGLSLSHTATFAHGALAPAEARANASDKGGPQDLRIVAEAQMDHSGHGAMSMPMPASGGDTYKIGDLVVGSPWTRATPGGAKIGGGYLKVTNNGVTVDRLVGATSSIADHVEIHEMSMTDGVTKMRPLTDGLEIKPGETVELKPGGFHMMFMDLKQPLKQGDTLKATLKFEKAGTLDVNFSINALGATGGMQHQH